MKTVWVSGQRLQISRIDQDGKPAAKPRKQKAGDKIQGAAGCAAAAIQMNFRVHTVTVSRERQLQRRQYMSKRIIVGISGASGIVYGVRALQLLSEARLRHTW